MTRNPIGVAFLLMIAGAIPTMSLAQDRGMSVRDSAGVHIVESSTPLWAAGRGWAVAATPMLSIGAVNGPPDQVLYRVGAVRRLPDGGLLVANQSVEVRRYDATGRLLWSTGRDGNGPGEFRSIGEFFVGRGDSIEVFESSTLRLTVLAPNGTFERVVTVRGAGASGQALGKLPDGAIVTLSIRFSQASQTGPFRSPGVFSRLNLTSARADSLFSVPGREGFAVISDDGGLMATQAFARMTLTSLRGSQLLTAENDRFEVRSFDTSGRLQQIARRSFEADLVTGEDIRDWKALAESAIARTTNPGSAARMQTRIALMKFPATQPVLALGSMIVDALGNVWLPHQYPDDADFATPTEFTVFDPAGRWLGVVRVPSRFRVSEIGADYIVGKFTDELGVEYVRVYALRKP